MIAPHHYKTDRTSNFPQHDRTFPSTKQIALSQTLTASSNPQKLIALPQQQTIALLKTDRTLQRPKTDRTLKKGTQLNKLNDNDVN